MSDPTRTAAFAKHPAYEARLAQLGALIRELPAPGGAAPQRPVVLVVGAPRSGTTLLSQVAAASDAFTWPSNLVARFHEAPWVGVRVQDALRPILPEPTWGWSSSAGLTSGWWEPHEFGYFWRRHLGFAPHTGDHAPSDAALDARDSRALARDLAAWETEAERPVLLKCVLVDFVLPWLAARLPTLRVVCARRDPRAVEASLLKVRERYFGDRAVWFSVRPPGADAVASRAPEEQVAFQVAACTQALDDARRTLGDRWLDVDYEALCADPRGVAGQVAALAGVAPDPTALSAIPKAFPRRRSPEAPR